MAYIPAVKGKDLKPSTMDILKKMGRIAYPNYKGRKWALSFGTSYQMENYWDGGSKTYAMAINLSTGEVSQPNQATNNPMNGAAHASFEIPPGFGIIEHCYFCGKDMGITLKIRPDETGVMGYVPVLPEPLFSQEEILGIGFGETPQD